MVCLNKSLIEKRILNNCHLDFGSELLAAFGEKGNFG